MPRTVAAAVASLALVAGIAAAGADAHGATRPVTLVTAKSEIIGFAQDGSHIAWATTDVTESCPHFSVRAAAGGPVVALSNDLKGDTCQFGGGTPVVLDSFALAGTRAVWAIGSGSNQESDLDVVLGRPGKPDKTVDSIAATGGAVNGTPADFHVPAAGNGNVLVWAIPHASSDFGDTAAAVRRSVGGRVGTVPHAGAATAIAINGPRVALAHGSSVFVRNVSSGTLVRSFAAGAPVAEVALTATNVFALTKTAILSITISGTPLGPIRVPKGAHELSASSAGVVYAVGRAVHFVSRTGKATTLARAGAVPVGLSIVGDRVAWAEGARVRALTVTG